MKYFPFCFLLTVLLSSCNNKKQEQKEEGKKAEPLFSLLDPGQTGIQFVNQVLDNDELLLTHEYIYNGSGVAAGDINNDGLPDLFFSAVNLDNKLYLNKGNLVFEDITAKAGIFPRQALSTGVTMVDINCDGFLDIYVCRAGKFGAEARANLLYINNGNLTFTEKAKEYGLADQSSSNQATFFDFDNDGDLDMYLVNSPLDYATATTVLFKPDTERQWVSDRLYRNNGNNTFTDVTMKALTGNKAFGFNAAVIDINGDGWQDIYVTNDFLMPDFLYVNNRNGTFTESLSKYFKHTSNSSMGSQVADFNNDGLMDVYTLDMMAEDNFRQKMLRGPMGFDDFSLASTYGYGYQYMRNNLQLNNGNGTFSEIGQLSGVSNTDWSWTPLMEDFDNDGWKDLYVANGYRKDLTNLDYSRYFLDSINQHGGIGQFRHFYDLLKVVPSTPLRSYVYRNNGDLTFADKSAEWGLSETAFSNGSVAADLDNDGDMDIIVNNIDRPAFVYRNNARALNGNHYIEFILKGNGKNPEGVDACITLISGDSIQCKAFNPTSGYYSSVENKLHFGLGKQTVVPAVKIKWSDGSSQVLKNVNADQVVTLDRKNAVNEKDEKPAPAAALFKDVTRSSGVNYVHRENNFIDFKREPMLPQMFSKSGPCIAAGDLNGDGLDDFFAGAATGFAGSIFYQKPDGTFMHQQSAALEKDKKYEDTGALIFDADGDGDQDLYVVSGGNEFDASAAEYQDRLYINTGKGNLVRDEKALPEMHTSGSCVTAGDYDGDGDQDLFVGGRILPGSYPLAPRSYILQNNNGKFNDVTEAVCPELMHPGLVCAALWTDFNGDKKPDLIVTGQWMKISVFRNNNGKLVPSTSGSGLDSSDGWWNCLSAGDFDHDGDIDYIAGNLGLNSRIKAKPGEPACVYASDFDNNGSLDAIMCYYIQGKSYPIHSRDMLIDQMRPLRRKFLRYQTYATATIYDIFPKEQVDTATLLFSRTFSSSYIENLGNGNFKIRELPVGLQLAPVNAVICDDFDQDGNLDFVSVGNSYVTEVETGRYDASIGNFMKGDGKGNFIPVKVTDSGFFNDKDARSMVILKSRNKKLIIIGNNSDTLKIISTSGNTSD
jgi:hypothetical protein